MVIHINISDVCSKNECCVLWTKEEKDHPDLSSATSSARLCDVMELYECFCKIDLHSGDASINAD